MAVETGVTKLLIEWNSGNQAAMDLLVPLVYERCAGWPSAISATSVRQTRYNRPHWCMKRICGW